MGTEYTRTIKIDGVHGCLRSGPRRRESTCYRAVRVHDVHESSESERGYIDSVAALVHGNAVRCDWIG